MVDPKKTEQLILVQSISIWFTCLYKKHRVDSYLQTERQTQYHVAKWNME